LKNFALGLFAKGEKQTEFVRRFAEGLAIGGVVEVGFFAQEIAG
jgi:hypothetical protein